MNTVMAGNCAVGLCIVDGPDGTSAAFTSDELRTINAEVLQGFDMLFHLVSIAPVRPHLVFVIERKVVKLALDPNTVPAPTGNAAGSEYSPCETPWRDAALAQLGLGAGKAGVQAYTQQLLNKAWPLGVTPTSAFVAFVTKYNTAWQAYTDTSHLWLVMQYAWIADEPGTLFGTTTKVAGWGTANIDRVFAHEVGHVFGAPDEALGSHCTTTSLHGVLQRPNGNCQTDPATPTADCMMRLNTMAVCQFTLAHWGLVDDNGDGVLDGLQVP